MEFVATNNMIDYCRRTVATVGGDGYREVIITEDDGGNCKIWTFSCYEPDNVERVACYEGDVECLSRILSSMMDQKILEAPRVNGGMCGGIVTLRLTLNGKVTRLSSEDIPYDYVNKIDALGSEMYASIDPQKEITE